MPKIRRYRGKPSKPSQPRQPRQHCREYRRLFACAQRKGLIIPKIHFSYLATLGNIPSYLLSSDFSGLEVRIGRLRKIQPILKPHAYCYKKSSSVPTPPSFIHTGSLDNLRKHSGCFTRYRGKSSSRFDGEKKHATHQQPTLQPSQLQDFGTEVTDFLKGPKGIITIVAVIVFFVLTKKI